MWKKNDLTVVTIEDLTRDGEGIGHAEGYTLFVKDGLPGDVVRARITRPKKMYAYARVETVLVPSPDRVEARCPHARRCGGCLLQEYDYPAQLRWKENYVRSALERIGGFDGLPVRPVIGMSNPFRYRNKAQYPVGMSRDSDGQTRLSAGFYAARTHSLIAVDDCVITGEVNQSVVREFLAFMEQYHIAPYDEKTHTGIVRHLLIREGRSSGQILVCPIVNAGRMPHAEELISCLRKIPGVCSISVNYNTVPGNTIMGRKTETLYGNGWIEDTIGSLTFRISPRSFFQVNPVQTEKLYGAAVEAAGLTGKETVYDLYCGIGTISLFAAQHAKAVYGVEIVADAVRDAKENAARNGIHNAFFFEGAAEKLVTAGEFEPGVSCPHADVVILDPPRKGCAPELIDAVRRMEPERIVYVSCDPATLARDLRRFREGDETVYSPEYVQPVDMFPQTCHVECVCLLSNKNAKLKDYVEIGVDAEDYYRIKDSDK